VEPLIAIDVALLPPQDVADAAIALSTALPSTESQGLVLGPTHLPHITLTQQFVTHEDLPQIAGSISQVVTGREVLPLRITGAGRGTSAVWMQVARTAALEDLHRRLMDALRPFERRGGTAAAFANADARPSDVGWVAGFRGSSAYERFAPHITLGHAARLPRVEPVAFHAGVVALCHLGRFCTCATILESWTLEAPPS
jgi:2'-5' RNA ligase